MQEVYYNANLTLSPISHKKCTHKTDSLLEVESSKSRSTALTFIAKQRRAVAVIYGALYGNEKKA